MSTSTGQGPGKRQDPNMEARDALALAAKRRRRFLVFCCLLVAAVLGANILYGTVLVTRASRSYCLDCHRASGPALMWEASDRHAPGLTCGPCHKLLPGQQGRCGAFSAHAETVNPNCMGCHPSVLQGRPLDKVVEVRLRAGPDSGAEPRVYRWPLEQLMYGWHLKKRICLCTDCHRNVSHERESRVFGHSPKMAYCQACHYHAVKDDYVQITPLPMLEIIESQWGNEG
jgi:hypothetical protein